MNNINLIGRVSTELELKNSKDVTYIKFNLAVQRPMKKDTTDFIPCIAFGKTAELIDKYVKKGERLGVNGQLISNQYESKGEKKSTYEVNIGSIDLIEPIKKEEGMSKEEKEKVKGTLLEPKHDLSNDIDDDFPF